MKRTLFVMFLAIFVLSGCMGIGLPLRDPDLIAMDFYCPSVIAPGAVIGHETGVSLKNVGNGDAKSNDGAIAVSFYLSMDKMYDPMNDIALINGSQEVLTPIKAGEWRNFKLEGLTVPMDIAPGTYYLLAIIDEYKEVLEKNKENNIMAMQVTVSTEQKADMIICKFESPQYAAPGDALQPAMVAEVKNIGFGTAESPRGYMFVSFFLSVDKMLDPSDILLIGGRETVYTPINSYEYRPVTLYGSMTIPAETAPGNYYVLAVVDEQLDVIEFDENNNIWANPICIGGQMPDLAPADFWGPETAYPGGIVGNNMYLNVINLGNTNAYSADGQFAVGFYLSTDSIFDPGTDILLIGGRDQVTTPMAPGECKAVPVNQGMVIPSNVTAGYYYLIAVVDDAWEVGEAVENNNTMFRPITILGGNQPDLVPTDLWCPSSSVPGGAIGDYLGVNVVNIGGGEAISADGHYAISLYLSTDTNFDASDVLLLGARSQIYTPHYSGESRPMPVDPSIAIPNEVTPGYYYLLAIADEVQEVAEGNEYNNMIWAPIEILGGGQADLVATDLYAPTSASIGYAMQAEISVNVKNIGAADAISPDGHFAVGFYLSQDQWFDPNSDILLIGGREQVFTPMGPGYSQAVQINGSMTVPDTVIPGSYYLMVVADEVCEVPEGCETNNVVMSPITITGGNNSDLIPCNFSSPATAYNGDIVGMNLVLDVLNIGAGSAEAANGYFFVGFYLSTDPYWDAYDMLLTGGREAVYTPVFANELKPVSIYDGMSLPYVNQGDYYILAVIDEFQAVYETDEGNNVVANPITIY